MNQKYKDSKYKTGDYVFLADLITYSGLGESLDIDIRISKAKVIKIRFTSSLKPIYVFNKYNDRLEEEVFESKEMAIAAINANIKKSMSNLIKPEEG